jgi:iron-sulfur cluster repair protein YtfE (RIC family)
MSHAEPTGFEAPPLREPLRWFFAEHAKHREFCRLLRVLAAAPVFDDAALMRAIDFLRNEIPQHLTDEDEDLFPALRRRALPEDDLGPALELLAAEHSRNAVTRGVVLEALDSCLAAQGAPSADPALRSALESLARHELQHLAFENAVVLPIARLRLTAGDLKAMTARLAARHRGPGVGDERDGL